MAYTPSLRLTLPLTGTLDGTWGDTVNNGITSLTDASIAGTAAVAQGDVANYTLTSNSGATDEARNMFLNITGALTAARNVVCPTVSKLYFIKNSTTGGFAITLKTTAGTGISIPNGGTIMALYCDGTNVIDAVSYLSALKIGGLTASQAVFTDASKNLVSNAITGTGNVVMSASPTLSGTIAGTYTLGGTPTLGAVTLGGTVSGGGNQINNVIIGASTPLAGSFTTLGASGGVTLSGGTANGVAYLDGSKVLTSGSALTFDGTNLGVGGTGDPFGRFYGRSIGLSSASGAFLELNAATGNSSGIDFGVNGARTAGITSNTTETQLTTLGATPITFGINGSEQMRLTSTGLGIGTSSPAYKLDVRGVLGSGNGTITSGFSYDSGGLVGTFSNHALGILTNGNVVAKFDTAGNLGLGVTPSAWSGFKAMQVGSTVALWGAQTGAGSLFLSSNTYYDGANFRYLNTANATFYAQGSTGTHNWNIAPSGTAGAAIAFTQAMTLDASGNLGIGTSSPNRKLDIDGSIQSRNTSSNLSYLYFASYADPTSSYSYVSGDGRSTGYLGFYTNNSEKMRLDSAGNLGLGVTPSAWSSGYKSMQFSDATGAFVGGSSYALQLGSNAYINSSSQWIYGGSSFAPARYEQFNSTHRWFTAPSGTAGAAVAFTQAMTLAASGNLSIGTTTSDARLDVWPGGSGGAVLRGSSGVSSQIPAFELRSFNINSTNGGLTIDTFRAGVFTTAVTLDASGNLGVGTSPAQKLDVNGQALVTNLYLRSDDSDVSWGAGSGSRPLIRGNTTNNTLQFYTASTERARIDSSGNLLVGITSSGGGKCVIETTSANQLVLSNKDTGAAAQYSAYFLRNNSIVGSIQTTNTTTIYLTASDYRLKTVTGPVADAGSRIDSLQPVEYEWKADGSRTRGFLAHQFQEVYAGSVTGEKDAVDEDGKPKYQAMQASSSEVIADLVAEIQSLRKRLAALETK